MSQVLCPRCRKNLIDPDNCASYSLSRTDNKTKICNVCGNEEAFADFFHPLKASIE